MHGGKPEVFQCAATNCAMAGIALPSEAVEKTGHRCHLCGSVLVPVEEPGAASLLLSPRVEWPVDLDPRKLPTHIAIPFEHYLVEPNTRVRLHWLVDTAEICVRWVAAVTIAEVAANNGGRLPKELADRVARLIQRPTLGAWVQLLRAVITHAPSSPRVASSFFPLVHSVLVPRFESSSSTDARDPDEHERDTPSLLELRNHLVHCGGLSSAAAERHLQVHRSSFEEMVCAIADAGDGLAVYAAANDRQAWLKGTSPVDAPPPPVLARAGDGTWLVARDQSRTISLSPLVTYRPVLSADGGWYQALRGDADDDSPGPVPQVYFRFEGERLFYTPLGVDSGISVELNTEPFRELFRLESVERNKPVRRTGWDRFLLEARLKQEGLIGRRDEVQRAKGWVKQVSRADPEKSGRIGWLYGAPGLGKSLLMAKLAHDAANGRNASKQVYFHAFRANDPDNTRWAFLRGLRAALRAWEAFQAVPLASAGEPLEGAELEADVRFLLSTIPELAQGDSDQPRLLVFIDGLDEAIKVDTALQQLIQDLALPATIWVVAGRPEPALMQAFVAPQCDPIFPGGLPPMPDADVRAMLMDGLADAGHRLAALDVDSSDGDPQRPVFNPYIQGVVQRAEGAPIYVRLLLEDLRNGRRRIEDAPERLPDTLEQYYREMIAGQGVAFDVNAHLGLVLAILASADEPLDREALAGLLQLRPTLEHSDRAAEWIDAACDLGRMLFTSTPLPCGRPGLTLYHLSLKEWLVGDTARGRPPAPGMEASLDQARWLLTESAKRRDQLVEESLHRHALRCGCSYLLRWKGEAGVAEVLAMITDSAVLAQTRCAWGSDAAGFFLSLHAVHSSLSERTDHGSNHTHDVAVALLTHWLDMQEPFAELETAHAVLNYRVDKRLYRALLSLADDSALSPRFQTPGQQWLQALMRARHANLLRKAGELDSALALLSHTREAFLALPPTPSREQELARLEYDAGYIVYLQGRFDDADDHLADSIHYSALAGDPVGEWISRCVRARFAALARMDGSADEFIRAMDRFGQVLQHAHGYFDREWQQSGNQHALRWLKNVQAHRFEVAFAKNDLPAAREAMAAFRDTLWVRRLAPAGALDRFEARLHLLGGDYTQAVAIFERFMVVDHSSDVSCLYWEEVASQYYQYGRALLLSGQPERAREAWQMGLRAPNHLGNSHWQNLLEAAIKGG